MRANSGDVMTQPIDTEPQILGIEPDLDSLALCTEHLSDIDYDDLYRIWLDPAVTSQTVRQYLVARLSAPDGNTLQPGIDQGIGRILHINKVVDGDTTNDLHERLADRQDLAEELATGVLFWLQRAAVNEQIMGRMPRTKYTDYRAVMRHLLPIVSQETAKSLFSRHAGYGDQSLGELVIDTRVPRHYRDTALTYLLGNARAEPDEALWAPTSFQSATGVLAEIPVTLFHRSSADAAAATTRIISFLEQKVPVGSAYMRKFNVSLIAPAITDRSARFAFALRHFTAQDRHGLGRLRVEDESELQLAEWVCQEAGRRCLPENRWMIVSEYILQYRALRQANDIAAAGWLSLQESLQAAI